MLVTVSGKSFLNKSAPVIGENTQSRFKGDGDPLASDPSIDEQSVTFVVKGPPVPAERPRIRLREPFD